jgi:predicted transcriptional regulator with HTH domain
MTPEQLHPANMNNQKLDGKMDLKKAILAYMSILGVDEYQHKLSTEERQIGSANIMGCLHAIEDRLTEKGDTASLDLVRIINQRETINGQIHDIRDPRLVSITRRCAEQTYDYYAKYVQ